MHELEMINDDARFDRLVDGQLPPAEYRTMLAGLDDEPSGWRRCALAFLEAQALERELCAVRDEKVRTSTQDNVVSPPRRTNYLAIAMAMTACFLAAFGMGLALRTIWLPGENGGNTVATAAPGEGHSTQGRSMQGRGESPQDSALVGNHPSNGEHSVPSPTREPLRNVTLVVGEDESEAQLLELPVVYYGDVGDEYFTSEHSAMSPEMLEVLQRSGHRLQRTQRFVPMEMGDGQHIVVPVEEVEIVPVGLPAF